MDIARFLDALSSQARLDPLKLAALQVPDEAGLYVWYSRYSGDPAYVGSAVGKGGLRRRICQQHLNPKYLERRTAKFRAEDSYQVENSVPDDVAIDKSAFRKNVARRHKLRAGQESVRHLKDNYCFSFLVLRDCGKEQILNLEREAIRVLNPMHNLRHKRTTNPHEDATDFSRAGANANAFGLANEGDKGTLESARHLIRGYLDAREGLKKLGILRSGRTLQGDYAEWLMARLLNLQLSDSSVEKGLDAKDSEGKTYQIKSRIVSDLSNRTSFDLRDPQIPIRLPLGCVLRPES